MPFHWTSRELRMLSPSSSVATQIPHAVGAALASKLRGERATTIVSFGDGATSKGDFHESLNMAGLWRLPVIFFCENNQYAISVPSSKQMATRTVAERAAAYNMPGYRIDGNDVLAVYGQVRQAIEQALDGGGPALIEAVTYRTMPHTSNDDDSKYRSREEVESWKARDPILRFRAYLAEAHLLDAAAADALAEQVDKEVAAATDRAMQAQDPPAREALDNLYAPGTRNAPRLDPRHRGVEEVAQELKSEIGA
jgi:2-oxoisovalerate dehydrogenase E1 component alpha subunit